MSRNKDYISMNENTIIENTAKAIEQTISSVTMDVTKEIHVKIPWQEMVGEYNDDYLDCVYLSEENGEPFLNISTYRGGGGDRDIHDAPLYVNDDGSLFYYDGGSHSFTIKFIDYNTIEICDDSWDTGLDGIYTKE